MLKRMKLFYDLLSVLLVTLLLCKASLAYDDEIVHPKINENAIKKSSFYQGTYIESLGFVTPEEKDKVVKWISKGGTDEDGTSSITPVDWAQLRYVRHFHDPLKSWSSAGWAGFYGNLAWAQADQQSAYTGFSGDWSWSAARTHYYNALTTGSEAEYADTFLTLGHQMHLISDMSVPAHVRNDLHDSATEVAQAPVPITALWDRNSQNDNIHEGIFVLADQARGIA